MGQSTGMQISRAVTTRQPFSSTETPVMMVTHWHSPEPPDEPELPDEPEELLPLEPLLELPELDPEDDELPLLEDEELLEDDDDELDEDELDELEEDELDDDELDEELRQHPSPNTKSSHWRLSGIHLAQPNMPAGNGISGGTRPSESTTVMVSAPSHHCVSGV